MRYQQMALTPDIAKELLGLNIQNRHIRADYVEALVRDIRAGRYRLNPQPIIVSASRRLLDGQHRLCACIRSGCVIPVVICWDAPEDCQGVIDCGRARRPADDISLAGRKNSKILAAAGRYVALLERRFKNPTQAMTRGEVLGVLARHEAGFRWVETVQKRPGLTRSPYLAVLVLAYPGQENEVQIFHEAVQLGVRLDAGDPALLLRTFMLERLRGKSGWTLDQELALKTALQLAAGISWDAPPKERAVLSTIRMRAPSAIWRALTRLLSRDVASTNCQKS